MVIGDLNKLANPDAKESTNNGNSSKYTRFNRFIEIKA